MTKERRRKPEERPPRALSRARRERLRPTILEMPISCGDAKLATALYDSAVFEEYPGAATLITQDDRTSDLYLLVDGTAHIYIKGQLIITRTAGSHVGELAAIDPARRRSATVTVTAGTITARVSEQAFTAIANRFPQVWRYLAKEIALRLRQRSEHVRAKNAALTVFLGSSAEQKAIVTTMERRLKANHRHLRPWFRDVFPPSATTIEALLTAVRETDIAVLVAAEEDRRRGRGKITRVPRDNIVFEIGLFMGHIGRERTLLLDATKRGATLPTDLLGVTTIRCGPYSGRHHDKTRFDRAMRDLNTALNTLGIR